MTPVPEAIDRPAGRPVADQAYAVVPPDPATVLLYAVPVTPFVSEAVVIVGAAFTVNAPVFVTDAVSGFVTVTSRAPVVAPAAIVMFAVNFVALLNVVEFTVMPVPENDATAPVMKFVPLIVMFWLIAFCPRGVGLVDVSVGSASIFSVNVCVATSSPSASLNVTVTDFDCTTVGVPEITPVAPSIVSPVGRLAAVHV